MLEATGATVDVAASVDDAMRIVESGLLDAAALDINLTGETSLPLAETLVGRGLPFVFATGYGDQVVIPAHLSHVPVTGEPYNLADLAGSLARAGAAQG